MGDCARSARLLIRANCHHSLLYRSFIFFRFLNRIQDSDTLEHVMMSRCIVKILTKDVFLRRRAFARNAIPLLWMSILGSTPTFSHIRLLFQSTLERAKIN